MTSRAQRRELRYWNPQEPLYRVGENWAFEWYHHEVDKVIKLYNADHKLPVIARRMDRPSWEVLMLINDLVEQKRIEIRPGWVWIK